MTEQELDDVAFLTGSRDVTHSSRLEVKGTPGALEELFKLEYE